MSVEVSFVTTLSPEVTEVPHTHTHATQEHLLEVPSEESVEEIRARYLPYNWHAGSYTWKSLRPKRGGLPGETEFQPLDMRLTMDENGIFSDVEEFIALHVPTDYYIPVIHLYWTDDLSVA